MLPRLVRSLICHDDRVDSSSSARQRTGDKLLEVDAINKRILTAAIAGLLAQIVSTLFVNLWTHSSTRQYLFHTEQEGSQLALVMIAISTGLSVFHVFVLPMIRSEPIRWSNVIVAGLIVNASAMIANGLLAYSRTVVLIDPVLGTKVYLIRWCEWIPLAGVMTYMSDIVSSTRSRADECTFMALSQTISTAPGFLFPFCKDRWTWSFLMLTAIVCYLPMFWRLNEKYHAFAEKRSNKEMSISQMQELERYKFSFFLFLVCTVVWTLLVIFYFLNATILRFAPEGHVLRHEAAQLMIDACFDVIAKGFYTALIVDVHYNAFQPATKADRSL